MSGFTIANKAGLLKWQDGLQLQKSKTVESLVLWLQATIAQALISLLLHYDYHYYYPYNSQREKQQMLLAIFL
jgi:hypothetical protein